MTKQIEQEPKLKNPIVFSENSKQALTFAQKAAQGLEDRHIGTEHILLGLVQEENVRTVLTKLIPDFDLKGINDKMQRVKEARRKEEAEAIGLTPATKKIIELACDEASATNSRYITPIHFLIATIKEEKGIAAKVLELVGISSKDMPKLREVAILETIDEVLAEVKSVFDDENIIPEGKIALLKSIKIFTQYLKRSKEK